MAVLHQEHRRDRRNARDWILHLQRGHQHGYPRNLNHPMQKTIPPFNRCRFNARKQRQQQPQGHHRCLRKKFRRLSNGGIGKQPHPLQNVPKLEHCIFLTIPMYRFLNSSLIVVHTEPYSRGDSTSRCIWGLILPSGIFPNPLHHHPSRLFRPRTLMAQ